MASRRSLGMIAGLIGLIAGPLAEAAPPTETPIVVEQTRVPAEQAAERYPVVTVPMIQMMDLPPPSPVSKRLDWHEVERTLRTVRQTRKEARKTARRAPLGLKSRSKPLIRASKSSCQVP